MIESNNGSDKSEGVAASTLPAGQKPLDSPSSKPEDPQGPDPNAAVQSKEPSAKEVAALAAGAIQKMKVDLVRLGAMVQWEADHYFESALKHLNGVS